MVCECGEGPAGAARARGGQWVWGNHYLPHDAEVRELGTGKSRVETLAGYGIARDDLPEHAGRGRHPGGARAAADLLVRQGEMQGGLEALRMYRREWDDRAQEFRTRPLHDWTSHYADAFRYFAVGHREVPAAAYGGRRSGIRGGWLSRRIASLPRHFA